MPVESVESVSSAEQLDPVAWLPLTYRVARGARARGADPEELRADLAAHLVYALRKYRADHPKGASVKTFLYECLVRRAQRVLGRAERAAARRRRAEAAWQRARPPAAADPEPALGADAVARLFAALPARQRAVARLYYGFDPLPGAVTLRAVARATGGGTAEGARQALARALVRLRREAVRLALVGADEVPDLVPVPVPDRARRAAARVRENKAARVRSAGTRWARFAAAPERAPLWALAFLARAGRPVQRAYLGRRFQYATGLPLAPVLGRLAAAGCVRCQEGPRRRAAGPAPVLVELTPAGRAALAAGSNLEDPSRAE